MEEEDIFLIQRKHIYLIVVGVILFSVGFAANSLTNYSPGAKEEELCSSPGRCGEPSLVQEPPLLLWNLTGEPTFSKEETGNRTLAYMTEKFLKPQGIEGELVDVKDYGEHLYVVDLTLKKGDTTQQTSVYVTKDGKLILLGEGGGIVDLPETGEPALLTPAVPQEEATTQPTAKETEIDISDAAYVTGSEDATVTIIEFNDFQCPFCKKFRDQTLDQVLGEYGERIKYVLMDFPITSIHPQAFIGHVAARCAGDQGKYFEYHDKLFANQQVWSRFASDSEDEINELKKYAVELGLDSALFDECLDSKRYAEKVLNNMQKGVDAGVTGTPTFFINRQKVAGAQPFATFQGIIEASLSGKTSPPQTATQAGAGACDQGAQLPAGEVTLATPTSITIENNPSLGSQDAKVTIIEYGDFSCGPTATAYETMSEVLRQYPGKIRFVYKNLQTMGGWSTKGMVASECAYVQSDDAFWYFYDKLFQGRASNSITQGNIDDLVTKWAGEAGLDVEEFKTCYANQETTTEIARDIQEARSLGISSTPTFIINGKKLVGAASLSTFQQVIDAELQTSGTSSR